MKIVRISFAVAAMCLLWSGLASAQLTQDQTINFPVGPPAGKSWTKITNFSSTTNSIFSVTPKPNPTENYYGRDLTYSDYDYYFFSGTHGKSFNVFISYGGSGATTAGSCAHTHLNYGVKGFYSVRFGITTFHGWIWVGGGTESGNWNATSHTCTRSVVSELSQFDPLFGWGTDFVSVAASIPLAGSTYFFDAFVLVVMAPTHSAGDCNPKLDPNTGITFKACLDPVNVFAYVL